MPDEAGLLDHRLIAVSAAGFCVFLSVYATQSLLPLLAHTFAASELRASLTVTATTVAVAIAAPVAGLIADRIGKRNLIILATFLLSIPTLLASTSHTLNTLVAWRFVQGLIMPGIIAVTMAYVSQEWPAHRVGTAMAAYVSGNVLGGVVGRLLTGWIAAHYGWQRSFIVLALLDVVGGIIIYRWLPRPRHPHITASVAESLHEMRQHLRNLPLLSSYLVGALILFSLVAIFTYVTYHLAAQPYNLGPAELGFLFAVYMVGVVVTPIGGKLIDRFGQRKSLMGALLLAAIGALLTLAPSLLVVVSGLALCASGVFVCQTATASYMGLAAGPARASAAGLYASCYYAGGASGAFIPGLLWRFGGWPLTVGLVVMLLAITAAVAWTMWKRETET